MKPQKNKTATNSNLCKASIPRGGNSVSFHTASLIWNLQRFHLKQQDVRLASNRQVKTQQTLHEALQRQGLLDLQQIMQRVMDYREVAQLHPMAFYNGKCCRSWPLGKFSQGAIYHSKKYTVDTQFLFK